MGRIYGARMGTLRKWAVSAFWLGPCLLLQCTGDQGTTECNDICSGLEQCHLLPSALALGKGPTERRANCVSRCELSHAEGQGDTAKVLDCYSKVSKNGVPQWNFCDNGSCGPLQVCLDSYFPGASATGEARVVVRGVIAEADLSGVAGASTDDEPSAGGIGGASAAPACPELANHSTELRAPTVEQCEKTGITRVRLSSVGVPPADLNFTQECGSALGTGFPILTIAAGSYDSALKVMGTRPVTAEQQQGAGGQGGAAGAAGTEELPAVAASEPFCWRVAGPRVQLVAGVVTSVDIVIPYDIAMFAHPTGNVTHCEGGCLTNEDTDNDGLSGCADPACGSVCARCPGVGAVGGPDCTNPGCAQFSFCRSLSPGGGGGGAGGTGGVGPSGGGAPSGGATPQGGSGGTPGTSIGGEAGDGAGPGNSGAAGGSNDAGSKH
jgi:hypothetical protein